MLEFLNGGVDHGAEVEIACVETALRAHAEKDSFDEAFGFARGGFHRYRILVGGGSLGDFFADQRDVTEERDEKIVEIVSEFADDGFEGLEAFVAIAQGGVGGELSGSALLN